MLQSFYIKDRLYTMKDVIKSTLHVFCRHNMRYKVMQRTTLHTYSQSRALGCGKELERIGSDLSWNFEWVLYVLRCIFLLFITLFGWLFLFWETWKGRPAELFRRTMTRASCLVSSDSPAACCLWFVSTCCRKYIFGRWGFQVYQTPLFTHQPRITSGDILSLWQGNYIPKCAGTVKMTVQSHTKSGHTTY